MICWETVSLKSRHGRLNPQNMKKNGPVVFEKSFLVKKNLGVRVSVWAGRRHDEVVNNCGCMVREEF